MSADRRVRWRLAVCRVLYTVSKDRALSFSRKQDSHARAGPGIRTGMRTAVSPEEGRLSCPWPLPRRSDYLQPQIIRVNDSHVHTLTRAEIGSGEEHDRYNQAEARAEGRTALLATRATVTRVKQ